MGDYSVRAILTAQDKGFTSTFQKANGMIGGFQNKLTSGLKFGAFAGVGQMAFQKITGAIGGMKAELDEGSRAWQSFEANAKMNGHTRKEINATRKSLQKYAQETIYNSSEMASTYAQLDAVGIKGAGSLVKAFGGIASASQNPKQAMMTLSQQGVQMASRPKVAWMDFKLMLEQSPAGMAAVAKAMGKTTSELVSDVQAGKVKTEDFFKAMKKAAGDGSELQKMARNYKTVGEAMDGMRETITNKLMPAYQALSKKGIAGVVAATDALESSIDRVSKAYEKSGLNGAINEIMKLASEAPKPLKQLGAVGASAFAAFQVENLINPKTFEKVDKGILKIKDGINGVPDKFLKLKDSGTKALFDLQTATGRFQKSSKGFDIWQGIYNKLGKVGAVKNAVTGKIGGIFGGMQSAIASKIGPVGSYVGNTFMSIGGQVTGGLGQLMALGLKMVMPVALIAAVIAGLGLLSNTYGNQMNQIITMMTKKGPQIITSFTQGIVTQLPTLIASGSSILANFLNGIAELMPTIMASATQIITTLVNNLAEQAPMLITSAVAVIGQFLVGLGEMLPELITSGINMIASLAQGIGDNLPKIIEYGFNAIIKFVEGISDNLPSILKSATKIIMSLAAGLVRSFPTIVAKGLELMFRLAGALITGIPQVIASIAKLGVEMISKLGSIDILAAGKKIMKGFLDGLKAGFKRVKNFVGGIADWVKAHKGPISYDKRLLIPAGKAIMNGLNRGLTENFKNVQRNVGSMAGRISSMMSGKNNFAFADGLGGLSGEYYYGGYEKYEVTVITELDGKEVARTTAKPMQRELQKLDKRNDRYRGKL